MKDMLKRGFTLIELLVVIVIIGILASGVFMMMNAGGDKSGIARTTAQVQAVASLLEEYKAQYGTYPIVADRDTNTGLCPIEFSFLCEPGTNTHIAYDSEKDNAGVVFGLFSHFIPRATTMNTESQNTMKDYYSRMFEEPPKGTVWEVEYTGGTAMNKISMGEQSDPRLMQINRAFRRLIKEGYVSAGSSTNIDTNEETYLAGASDSWGHALRYRMDGSNGEIVSAGPDGQWNSEDDITSVGSGARAEDDDE